MGGPQQGEYFDFLNGGAGGTRQWDVALSRGVKRMTGAPASTSAMPCGCDLCRQTRPGKRLATLLHPTYAEYRPGVCLCAAEISADGCRHPCHCARIDRQCRSRTGCVHERTRRFWERLMPASPVALPRYRQRCNRPCCSTCPRRTLRRSGAKVSYPLSLWERVRVRALSQYSPAFADPCPRSEIGLQFLQETTRRERQIPSLLVDRTHFIP